MWLIPILSGLVAAATWAIPPALGMARFFGDEDSYSQFLFRTVLQESLRQGVAAFVVGFGVACAALAYRESVRLRREVERVEQVTTEGS